MTAATRLQELPFKGKTPNGMGFFPPMLRAAGHTLYLLGMMADEKITVTDEESLVELQHAKAHWDARTETQTISIAARDTAERIGLTLGDIITEWPTLAQPNRTALLRDFNNRLVQYAADLDRELTGIADSDPGTSL